MDTWFFSRFGFLWFCFRQQSFSICISFPDRAIGDQKLKRLGHIELHIVWIQSLILTAESKFAKRSFCYPCRYKEQFKGLPSWCANILRNGVYQWSTSIRKLFEELLNWVSNFIIYFFIPGLLKYVVFQKLIFTYRIAALFRAIFISPGLSDQGIMVNSIKISRAYKSKKS